MKGNAHKVHDSQPVMATLGLFMCTTFRLCGSVVSATFFLLQFLKSVRSSLKNNTIKWAKKLLGM